MSHSIFSDSTLPQELIFTRIDFHVYETAPLFSTPGRNITGHRDSQNTWVGTPSAPLVGTAPYNISPSRESTENWILAQGNHRMRSGFQKNATLTGYQKKYLQNHPAPAWQKIRRTVRYLMSGCSLAEKYTLHATTERGSMKPKIITKYAIFFKCSLLFNSTCLKICYARFLEHDTFRDFGAFIYEILCSLTPMNTKRKSNDFSKRQ